MPPAIAAFDRVKGIGPDNGIFPACVTIDPGCRPEEGDHFHFIIGGIPEPTEITRDFHDIAVGDECPSAMSGTGFETAVGKDVESVVWCRG